MGGGEDLNKMLYRNRNKKIIYLFILELSIQHKYIIMKSLLFSIHLLFSCILVNAQKLSTYSKVTDMYYMGKYEVTNRDYRDYLNHLMQSGLKEQYKKSLPDTTLWEKTNNVPYSAYYFSYLAYEKYPLVGISYENAVAYCQWLTDAYNSNAKREFKKVLFKLPTEKEWTYAANGGNDNQVYTWNSPFLFDRKNGYLCNFLRVGDNLISYDNAANTFKVVHADNRQPSVQDRATIPAPVASFPPNQFGIYNQCGNVAEMVSEKGIAKGGSYNDPGYDVRIASVKSYSKPSVEIGFRVAMVIVEK